MPRWTGQTDRIIITKDKNRPFQSNKEYTFTVNPSETSINWIGDTPTVGNAINTLDAKFPPTYTVQYRVNLTLVAIVNVEGAKFLMNISGHDITPLVGRSFGEFNYPNNNPIKIDVNTVPSNYVYKFETSTINKQPVGFYITEMSIVIEITVDSDVSHNWLWIIIAVVIFLAIIVGVWYWYSGSSTSSDDNNYNNNNDNNYNYNDSTYYT